MANAVVAAEAAVMVIVAAVAAVSTKVADITKAGLLIATVDLIKTNATTVATRAILAALAGKNAGKNSVFVFFLFSRADSFESALSFYQRYEVWIYYCTTGRVLMSLISRASL
jgi:hypothetical protein